MPQPLDRKLPSVHSYNLGLRAMEHRPELAVAFSSVIASWASVELALASALCEAMEASAEPFAAAFQALNSTSAQANVAEAAIQTVIGDELRSSFEVLMKRFWSAKKVRDRLAHGIWGWCDQLPEALLWVDPKRLVMREAMFAQNSKFVSGGSRISDAGGKHVVTAEHIVVYEARDFQDALQRNERLAALFSHFGWCVWPETAKDPEALRQLLQQPEIVEGLARRG